MIALRNKKMSNNVLASRINKLRTISGLSQAAFGASIGTSQAALSAYEKGIRTPSLDILIDISKKYHVSIDWLSGLSDIPNSAQIVKERIEGGANEKAVLRLFINCPFVCINFDFFWLNKARQLYMDF